CHGRNVRSGFRVACGQWITVAIVIDHLYTVDVDLHGARVVGWIADCRIVAAKQRNGPPAVACVEVLPSALGRVCGLRQDERLSGAERHPGTEIPYLVSAWYGLRNAEVAINRASDDHLYLRDRQRDAQRRRREEHK